MIICPHCGWEIVYRVIRTGADWRIDSATTVDKPGWIRC